MSINSTGLIFNRVKTRSNHKLIFLSVTVILSFIYLEHIGIASPYATAHSSFESPQKPKPHEKVAFDMDSAAPNEMTSEKSEEIHRQQIENGIITDDSVDNSSPASSSSTQDEPTETNAAQPHRFDIQKAEYNQKKLYSRSDSDKTIQAIVITVVAVSVIAGVVLLAARAKNKK